MDARDPKLHYVTVTAIVIKEGKALIARRGEHEKTFPGKWTVPGGKVVHAEYESLPKTSENPDQWYNVVEWTLRKEVREEVGLEVGKPRFLCDLVFMRPNGYPTVTLSYWAPYQSGEVTLCEDLSEFAWIGPGEAASYDLIDGIAEEIEDVFKELTETGK